MERHNSYSYSINGITFQASNTFSGLAAGSYNFTIKDANNCITTTSATITQPQSTLGYTLLSQSNVTCFGGSNGSLNVTGFGGTAPYQYKLDFGAYQSSGSFNGLNAGTYNVSIKDATNCTITFPITISQPINPLSSSITYQKNVSCYGDATGIVTVVGSGGTGPIYTYKMDNGNFQSSGTFNGLSSINSNPLTQGDRFELFVSKSSSVEDLVNNPQISVAPNPVVDEFTIWTNAAISNDAHLEIRNANAQIVMSRKLNQSEQSGIKVNTKDWAAGVYFIVINNNGKLISEKVIKK